MGAVKALFTFKEFERMEFKPGKQELIHGELIELLPELRHQKISHRIFNPLNAAMELARSRSERSVLV